MLVNSTNIPLGLAVFLANDTYDYKANPNYISATQLLKPLKQIILSRRVDPNAPVELESLIPMSYGTAIHGAIENAWMTNYEGAMKALGYPDKVIKRIKLNPTKEDLEQNKDIIPIWLEQRAYKELDGMTVGGKFDMILEGQINDFKSTSVYTYLTNSHEEDYRMQGSIYRWLNQDKVTSDYIKINFIFTDWSSKQAQIDANYPKSRIKVQDIKLHPIHETERQIKNKIKKILEYRDKAEEDIPRCTDEELWRTEGKWKYYANPNNLARATKVFDSKEEANTYWLVTKQGKGMVQYVPGEVRRCKYCAAAPICKQCKEYFPNGIN